MNVDVYTVKISGIPQPSPHEIIRTWLYLPVSETEAVLGNIKGPSLSRLLKLSLNYHSQKSKPPSLQKSNRQQIGEGRFDEPRLPE